MGNSNSEPLSNKLGVGLYSADGPLYLWHDFMKLALNQPWDWNGHAPVPNGDFAQPPGVVTASVCRYSGMAATGACGPTITVPFLDGTVPPRDNVHVNKQGGGGARSSLTIGQRGGNIRSAVVLRRGGRGRADCRRPRDGRAANSGGRFVTVSLAPRAIRTRSASSVQMRCGS